MLAAMGIGEYVGIILGSSIGLALTNWAASSRIDCFQQRSAAAFQQQKEAHEAKLPTMKLKLPTCPLPSPSRSSSRAWPGTRDATLTLDQMHD